MNVQNSEQSDALDRFIRVSGFLFFIFGLLAIIFRIIQFFIMGDPPIEDLVLNNEFLILQGIPSLFAAIFFISGASALYLRQANQLGLGGLIIYFFTFSAMVISSGAMWSYAFTAPVLAREAPHLLTSTSSGIIQAVIGSMALGQIGWLLLAIVSLRARIVPRWALLIAIVSNILVVIMTPFAQTQLLRLIFNVLLGAGPLAIGYVLWQYRKS
jgi:hypothetical protein